MGGRSNNAPHQVRPLACSLQDYAGPQGRTHEECRFAEVLVDDGQDVLDQVVEMKLLFRVDVAAATAVIKRGYPPLPSHQPWDLVGIPHSTRGVPAHHHNNRCALPCDVQAKICRHYYSPRASATAFLADSGKMSVQFSFT